VSNRDSSYVSSTERGDRSNMNRSERDRSGRDRSEMPVNLTVPTGTHIEVQLNDELSSRKNKPGDTFTASVVTDVRDASGVVVIPEGSKVNGSIVAVKPAPNRRTPGTLTLAVSTIETNGKTFPVRATIDSLKPEYQKQDVNAKDAAKVGVGAAAGAAVGQIISKNTKGTVIGAVVGGMAGAGVAAETKDLDIVLPDDSHFVLMIVEPLKVAVDRDQMQSKDNKKTGTNRSY
jgi:hypothetical protein